MSIVIREQAARDIESLRRLIELDHPRSAAKFAATVARTIRLLERLPLLGSVFPWSADDRVAFRYVTLKAFRNIVLIHIPLPDGIEVVRVVDGRRNLAALVRDIDP